MKKEILIMLFFNGRSILRFKKISENNIHDGDKVQLMIDEF